jgi:general secretion pathway protein B
VSYILDALKKSDSERQQRQGPTLATVQQQHYVYQRSNKSWVMLFLAALAMVLSVAGFWLYQMGYLKLSLPRPVVLSQPIATVKSEIPAQQAAPAVSAPGPMVGSVDSNKAAAEYASTMPAPTSAPAPVGQNINDTMPPAGTLLELWQLPAALRAGVPPLNFSLHVYSTRRDQRSIIINNRMMREGEYVNPQLALSAITPDGVVMKYRNEYFRVSILDNW